MTAVTRALELIKPFEGCKLRAYLCPAGVWTIGYGATGQGIGPGVVWTQDQAENRLLADVARFYRGVSKLVTVPVNEFQAGALTSFAFNVGLQALAGSTLLRLLNAGQYPQASEQFMRWDKAGGKRLNGLTRRRAAEKAMFDRD